MPRMCSLAKCIWVYKHIRALVYLLMGSLLYAMLYFVAKRFIPNIILTGRFAKASLKVTNGVRLSPIFFPLRKINRKQ